MAMPEHVRSGPNDVPELQAELSALADLVRELEHADAERVREAIPAPQERLEVVRELGQMFASAMELWADPKHRRTCASWR